jgi:hypothetical protein
MANFAFWSLLYHTTKLDVGRNFGEIMLLYFLGVFGSEWPGLDMRFKVQIIREIRKLSGVKLAWKLVIGCFFGNHNTLGMALQEAGIGDTDKGGFCTQIGQAGSTYVTHA